MAGPAALGRGQAAASAAAAANAAAPPRKRPRHDDGAGGGSIPFYGAAAAAAAAPGGGACGGGADGHGSSAGYQPPLKRNLGRRRADAAQRLRQEDEARWQVYWRQVRSSPPAPRGEAVTSVHAMK
eukprot:COSAG01_NODE_338_length_18671_cov_259.238154_18_plen_126_part_00